ncbi:hypothetical protein FSHL1_009873 [Fusarium sambucinum]
MKNSLLELDPDADALLILQCPNLQRLGTVKEQSALSKNEKAQTRLSTLPRPKRKAPTNFDRLDKLPPYDEYGNPTEIKFRVSAKHLCLASPVFRKMLKGDFQESIPNDDGLLEIKTKDWNAQALLILLDIIHGHHLKVHKSLELHTIAHIGILIDYYDCFEIVEAFSDHWLWSLAPFFPYKWPTLENSINSFGETEVLLLFIAWSFRETLPFQSLVYSAIYGTSDVIKTSLPIPVQILDKIEQQRTRLLEERFRQLYNLQDDLSAGRVGCTPEYSCQLLDYLMRQMRDNDLPISKPEHPFVGFSFNSVNGFMKGIRTPWQFNREHTLNASGNQRYGC